MVPGGVNILGGRGGQDYAGWGGAQIRRRAAGGETAGDDEWPVGDGECIDASTRNMLGTGVGWPCRLRGGGSATRQLRVRGRTDSALPSPLRGEQQQQGQKASGIKPPTRTRMGAELAFPTRLSAESGGTSYHARLDEVLVGKDVEPTLGLRVVMSETCRKTRPFVQVAFLLSVLLCSVHCACFVLTCAPSSRMKKACAGKFTPPLSLSLSFGAGPWGRLRHSSSSERGGVHGAV